MPNGFFFLFGKSIIIYNARFDFYFKFTDIAIL